MSCPVCSLTQAVKSRVIDPEVAVGTAMAAGTRRESIAELCRAHRAAVERARKDLDRADRER